MRNASPLPQGKNLTLLIRLSTTTTNLFKFLLAGSWTSGGSTSHGATTKIGHGPGSNSPRLDESAAPSAASQPTSLTRPSTRSRSRRGIEEVLWARSRMRDEELDTMDREVLLSQYKRQKKKSKILVKKTSLVRKTGLCSLKRRDTGKACSVPLSR